MQLKAVKNQAIVIVGASSGIGRECALRFAERGAKVVAVSVYARAEDTKPEEFRRVMEVNYLGQVHGALARASCPCRCTAPTARPNTRWRASSTRCAVS